MTKQLTASQAFFTGPNTPMPPVCCDRHRAKLVALRSTAVKNGLTKAQFAYVQSILLHKAAHRPADVQSAA